MNGSWISLRAALKLPLPIPLRVAVVRATHISNDQIVVEVIRRETGRVRCAAGRGDQKLTRRGGGPDGSEEPLPAQFLDRADDVLERLPWGLRTGFGQARDSQRVVEMNHCRELHVVEIVRRIGRARRRDDALVQVGAVECLRDDAVGLGVAFRPHQAGGQHVGNEEIGPVLVCDRGQTVDARLGVTRTDRGECFKGGGALRRLQLADGLAAGQRPNRCHERSGGKAVRHPPPLLHRSRARDDFELGELSSGILTHRRETPRLSCRPITPDAKADTKQHRQTNGRKEPA